MASSPYATLGPLLGTLPKWLPAEDAERRRAYEVYEDIYDNVPTVFRLDQRGTNARPIYIPSGKTIIEASNRFVGRGFNWRVIPTLGTTGDQAACSDALTKLFRRENWRSKFATQKRYGLIRGDSYWHVVGNETAAPLRRLSIYELHPGDVMPIYDEENLDRVIGYHLIEYLSKKDNPELRDDLVRRQTYMKVVNGDSITITSHLADYKVEDWEKLDARPERELKPEFTLPPEITSLPVYHVKNGRVSGWNFGVSEMKGLERIMGAVNQAISDEELALALDGIGMYATTSGPPQDENGKPGPWILGPGRVVEHAIGTDFARVSGVGSVTPYQDHVKYLEERMQQASGTPDMAIGQVDVSVAESGIALELRMGPVIAKSEEKNDLMLDTHDQMFYDIITMWFPAYESQGFGDVQVEAQVGDVLPPNRKAKFDEIVALHEAGLVDTKWCLTELTKLGYDFTDMDITSVLAEVAARAVAADPYAAQAGSNADGTGTDPNAAAAAADDAAAAV